MRKKNVRPPGEAETKRRERRADAYAKLQHAQEKLAEAKLAHEKATQAFLSRGIGASTAARDAAKKQMDDMLLYIEHYKSALAVYDGEEVNRLCREWDSAPSGPAAFRSAIADDAKAAEKLAIDLVKVMVAMREKFAQVSAETTALGPLKKELGEYGIVVRPSRATLLPAQQAIALALRKALTDAGLNVTDSYVMECLSPRYYELPLVNEKEAAA